MRHRVSERTPTSSKQACKTKSIKEPRQQLKDANRMTHSVGMAVSNEEIHPKQLMCKLRVSTRLPRLLHAACLAKPG